MGTKISFVMLFNVLFICFACSNRISENVKGQLNKDASEVINMLLLESKTDEFENTICPNFLSILSDSTFNILVKILQFNNLVDSTANLNDLLTQYKTSQNEKVETYIDKTQFVYINNIKEYMQMDFNEIHFVFTYPIFYNNNKKCFIYSQDIFSKQGKAVQIVHLFEKKINQWEYMGAGQIDIDYESFELIIQDYFVKKKYLPH
jgi:hypothetical protein